VYENYPATGPSGDATHRAADVRFTGAQTAHALTIILAEGRELMIRVVHDRRRVGDRAAEQVVRHLQRLLGRVGSDPLQRLSEVADLIPEEEIPDVGPPRRAAASAGAFVAPRTRTEEAISRMWTEVLGLERIGVNDNFFELGGHSLVAMQFMSRLRDVFQVELPLRVLFESGTIAELAGVVEEIILREIEALPEDEAARLLSGATGEH
jgi:acyl carrier protein